MKIKILVILISAFLIFSCEDPAPFDYKEEHYVEAYLTVGEPVNDIRLFRTLPLDEPYSLENSIIKDADITIYSENNEELNLEYKDNPSPGYYYEQDYSVKPETFYYLRIETSEGNVYTDTTRTPAVFEWEREPVSSLHYPKDTLKLSQAPDSTKLYWTKSGNVNFYIVNVKCLDTLEYGKYLNPPTEEKNRRVYLPFNDVNELYRDRTTLNLIANTTSPVVWFAFRWFGNHEITIQAPDNNYLRWYLQYLSFQGDVYDPNLNTISGGAFGVFGSVAEIKTNAFLYKNQ